MAFQNNIEKKDKPCSKNWSTKKHQRLPIQYLGSKQEYILRNESIKIVSLKPLEKFPTDIEHINESTACFIWFLIAQ